MNEDRIIELMTLLKAEFDKGGALAANIQLNTNPDGSKYLLANYLKDTVTPGGRKYRQENRIQADYIPPQEA